MVSVLSPSSRMPPLTNKWALSAKIRCTSPLTVTRFARDTLPCTTYQPFVAVSLQALSSSVTTVAFTVYSVPAASRYVASVVAASAAGAHSRQKTSTGSRASKRFIAYLLTGRVLRGGAPRAKRRQKGIYVIIPYIGTKWVTKRM